jgi:hypothetical protein
VSQFASLPYNEGHDLTWPCPTGWSYMSRPQLDHVQQVVRGSHDLTLTMSSRLFMEVSPKSFIQTKLK